MKLNQIKWTFKLYQRELIRIGTHRNTAAVGISILSTLLLCMMYVAAISSARKTVTAVELTDVPSTTVSYLNN